MQSVLVTGTSSGIGLVTALTLARAGYRVYATMRNPESGSEHRDRIEREKLPVSIVATDVDSDESVATAFNAIRSAGESVDVLVNNAGIERAGSVEELSLDDFVPRWRRTTLAHFAAFAHACARCVKGAAGASST